MSIQRGALRTGAAFLILLVVGIARLPTGGQPAWVAPQLAQAQADASELRPYRIGGVTTREQRSAINAAGVAIESVGPDYVVVVGTPAELSWVASLGFAISAVPQTSAGPTVDPTYHTYDQMVDEIHAVAAAHPAIVQLFSIGQSTEGRVLWAAKISADAAQDVDQPEALFVGHYHAREHLTVEMLLYLLHLLADNYGVSGQEQITNLVDTREIYLIFDLNPDGGEYDTLTGFYQFWRKNRQRNRDGSYGIDLNRNHSYGWACCAGSSSISTSETYHGPAPASAPEVRAIEAFVNGRVLNGTQQISVAITFHTYSELVLWPYGFTYEQNPPNMRADDRAVFATLGQAMAQSNRYTAMQASGLYITDGDFVDWAYGVHRIFAFTFEMYPANVGIEGFYPPGSVIKAETERNREAVLYLLDHAGCPYTVTGTQAAHCTGGRTNPPLRMWVPLASR